MNIVFWILQIIAAGVFFMAGLMKLRTPKAELQKQMGWAEDFSQTQVRLIGTAEVLGALGLVLPGLFGIAPQLTAWAALGLTVLMLGASYTHMRRKEQIYSLVPLVLAAAVFVGRFFVTPL